MTNLIEYKIEKRAKSGWVAITNIKIDDVPATATELAGERILRISTRKHSFNSFAISSASVHTARPSGHGYTTETHAMGMGTGCGDYSATILRDAPARITERVIRGMHLKALRQVDDIREAALAHYAAQELAKEA
jgi:hypothetical protein